MSAAAVIDAPSRGEALDPARSFIVQAPAGSGKTGLLIQRYLRLLATVSKPEEVLAITFTRKAAAEMRRRVLRALDRARDAQRPERENDALTWELAREALARDGDRGWGILANAARLRIQTIDSLCASLGRQMPVLSSLGATPAIVEDARELYREAAERTLGHLSGGDALAAPVARVLRHLDGDWGALRSLLETMLAGRDQWLRRVGVAASRAVRREALEAAFRAERGRVLRRLREIVPQGEVAELLALARYAASNVEGGERIARLRDIDRMPVPDESGVEPCQALAELLLTSEKERPRFRQEVNKRQGFPKDKGAAADLKKRMHELLGRLQGDERLCEALNAVRMMPPPAFTDAQWEVLGAVIEMLPRAAAELHLVFAERGRIDFAGIAQAAVQALGAEEEPTNLLLALDVQVKHLLVDEFQDTSHGQWDLFARLTAGWQPGDGRTVFLVGDPMQSIYRFREADVALFLRARLDGLPQVGLGDLRLSTNFRAQGGLVEWLNRHFPAILAETEEPDDGAVRYSESSAHHPAQDGDAITWHAFLGTDPALARDREAQRVAAIAREALASPDAGSVAILVRTRSNLDKIVPLLRKLAIPFRAVEIESLQGRQVIQDLLAITRALSHPADRVAWLGLLRAPWCAMTLADLHALTGGTPSPDGLRATVWELLAQDERLQALSTDGRARLARLRSALEPFMAHRLRGTLRERVEAAWLALGGPACADAASDLDDAETFFDQLDDLEHAGDLPDAAILEQHLERLYAAPGVGEEARLQVMTIHKAKGLEFDTVIVPGMDRVPRVADRQLFYWKTRADGTMLMAPIRSAEDEKDPAYQYMRSLDKVAAGHELERLLYVAATRARKRVHLLGYVRLVEKDGELSLRPPPPNTLLGKAWSAARPRFEEAIAEFRDKRLDKAQKPAIRTELRRLDPAVLSVTAAEPACPPPVQAAGAQAQIEFSWAGETARHVGTITHRWLQRVATEGLALWDAQRIGAMAPRIARELLRLGVPPADREKAAARVMEALTRAITEERGRWVLAAYPDARCEYRIRVAGPDGVKLLVIDRIFTAEGKGWIVDYKTSSHEGGDLETFLDREKSRYAEKMQTYVPALGGTRGSLGLYFPLVGGWREWEA